MTHRRRWLAIALAVVCAVVGSAVVWHSAAPDCAAVRKLVIDGNEFYSSFADAVALESPRGPADLSGAEAGRLAAAGIDDAGLARRARMVDALAGELAVLVPRPPIDAPEGVLQRWRHEVVRVAGAFNENLAELAQACPDQGRRIRLGGAPFDRSAASQW